MTRRELTRLYLPALLFGALAGFSAFRHVRLVPGLGLLAIGYAIPFGRRQLDAVGKEAARWASLRFLILVLGWVCLLAGVVAPPTSGTFWIIGGVGLAVLLPTWVWAVRLLGAAGREGDNAVRLKEID